ncbi:hypothetical protein IEQ34_007718 [Dendrobium chrysotoxum]|uniref:Uncharacterized protein n=1 Tax=Dendrobium chrysotoxum TaxID=161865 RepID=A0AAV7H263_DENCH|nr:hypothetical protein IEQ34_007718 [Dendrobium chrysotoxum]
MEAQAMITQLLKDQKISGEKVAILKDEKKKSQTLIAEKEAALFGLESSKDHLQEAREHIYDVEVKALDQQYMDEGFTQGFLKGMRSSIDGLDVPSPVGFYPPW